MPWPHEIVTGQSIASPKIAQSKALRSKMTPPEEKLWHKLRDRKLGIHFRRQQVIAGYIVDFYCHSAALVVEVDGVIHDNQKEADAKREAALAELGLRILRFANRQIDNDLPKVLDEITYALSLPLPFREGAGG
ncbi:MAG: endonuclease domain-containing protein [Candidatus Binataceae bacterium]